jgi:dethiobiotin synthetase
MKGLFLTGTDTGVGKTTVGCALVAAFARRGLQVAPMKPCETGDGDDACRLAAAAQRDLDPALVNPYRFRLPASPEAAAAAEGAAVDLQVIAAAYRRLTAGADLAIVEGAGGLLVPLGGGRMMADLAATLTLPVLIVARPSLGTINHTLLTVEAARHRGLRVLGVVFSRMHDLAGPDEPTNPAAIARHGAVQIFGALPCLADPAAPPDSLARVAERHLDLDALLAAI